MSLTQHLARLADTAAYPGANEARIRWGQLIRQSSVLSEALADLVESNRLRPFGSLGSIRGGVVTRANAFFIVRELPFGEIPARLRVTRADWRRVGVIVDGLDHVAKIERQFLKPIIKGPESLESAFSLRRTDLRLIDVREDKEHLQRAQANGVLAYLRRGETVDYKTSDDDLKGGIPAQRSQVRNRRPHWYSLQGDQRAITRIVFPEHIDRRYVFTLVSARDPSIVIDKLYLFEPVNPVHAPLVHVSLNSLLTWYQVELRGRSQMGEGVLELKIPDYEGLLVLNPDAVTQRQRESLLSAFADLPSPGSEASFSELGTAARHNFDVTYLRLCRFPEPEAMALRLEGAVRALASERTERKLSVADAKISRRRIASVAASVDAYATRIASGIEPHPDPRTFVSPDESTDVVPILGPVEGPIEIGGELFNQGHVLAGGACIARAGNTHAAQFVRGVLLIQPDLTQVNVPVRTALEDAVTEWTRDSRRWHLRFKENLERVLVGMDDQRTRQAIEQRALRLLHAI